MTELKIDPTLQALLPPLAEEQRRLLEQDILEKGCLLPIITWKKTIIDGHNRYEICTRLKLPFKIEEIELESLEHATWWILTHQLTRRNLAPFQRAEVVLKLKPFAEAEARKNQGRRKKNEGKGRESMESLKKLETLAGMSHETLRKAERIIEQKDEAVLERLRTGSTTINKEYAAIKRKKGAELKVKPVLALSKSVNQDGPMKEEVSPENADLTPQNDSASFSKDTQEELTERQLFLRKHYCLSQIEKLEDDILAAFPDACDELALDFVRKTKERIRWDEFRSYIALHVKRSFEMASSDTQEKILPELVAIGKVAKEKSEQLRRVNASNFRRMVADHLLTVLDRAMEKHRKKSPVEESKEIETIES